MIAFGSGCAANEPQVEYCTPVTIYQDKLVTVPESLTVPVEVTSLSPDFDLIDLGVGYKINTTRLQQCNGRLVEIGQIK